MEPVAKHYYRAIIYHYVCDDSLKAQEECYQALEHDLDHTSLAALLKSIQQRSSTSIPNNKGQVFLDLIENEELDTFLIRFLSLYDLEGFVCNRIDWQLLNIEFGLAAKGTREYVTNPIWQFILKKEWQSALSLARDFLLKIQGSSIAYFQIGYCLFKLKRYVEAEPYFFLLAKCGSSYATSGTSLLLKLPKHNFSSLRSHWEIMEEAHQHNFELAHVLQLSWDHKAFVKYCKLLFKSSQTPQQYLQLAQIYLKEGIWGQLLNCLKKALPEKNHHKILMLLSHEISLPNNIKNFLIKLAETCEDFNLEGLEEIFPEVSLAFYQAKIKSTPGNVKWILGKAISFFYLEQYQQAEKVLVALGSTRNKDILDKVFWALETYPQSKKALLPMFYKATQVLCPVCGYLEKKKPCSNCAYNPINTFKWRDNRLRWQGKILFPETFAIVTSNSLQYLVEQPAYFIVFIPAPLENAQVQIYYNDELVFTAAVQKPGISLFREKFATPGIYKVVLQSGTSNLLAQYFFMVSREAWEWEIKWNSISWENQVLELAFYLQDRWGFFIEEEVQLEVQDLFYKQQQLFSVLSGKKIIKVSYQSQKEIGLISLTIKRPCGERIVQLISPDFCLWNNISQTLLEGIPKEKFTYALSRENLLITPKDPYQEILAVLQPLGNEAVEVHHFKNVPKQKALSIPRPKSFSGLYLGTTRFLGDTYQQVGIEISAILMGLAPSCKIKCPQEVLPGEKFTISLSSSKPLDGVLIVKEFCGSYFPMQNLFLKQIIGSRAKQSVELEPPLLQDSLVSASYHSQIMSVNVRGNVSYSLEAPIKQGIYEIIFILSNGHHFCERFATFKVQQPQNIEIKMPKAIGIGDYIEIAAHFYTNCEAQLQVSTDNKGLLLEKKVQKLNTETIVLTRPDRIHVSFGDIKRVFDIRSLIEQQTTHNTLLQKKFASAHEVTYKNTFALLQKIKEALWQDPHKGSLTLAAQLHAAIVEYRLVVAGKLAGTVTKLEEAILVKGQMLFKMRQNYQDSWLQKWPGDKDTITQMLYLLSPFLKIPKFSQMQTLAQEMLDIAKSRKIKDNKLFFLDTDFAQKTIKNPETAAILLLYNINSEKALGFLEKQQQQQSDTVFWQGDCLGGIEETTAIAARTLFQHKHILFSKALKYLCRLKNMTLSNPIATIAFMELLLEIAEEEDSAWFCENEVVTDDLAKPKQANFRIKIKGPKILHPGDKFTCYAKIKKLAHPYVRFLVPPHFEIIKYAISGDQMVWPEVDRKLEIHCKALCKGTGTFYIVAEERYQPQKAFKDGYYLVIL